jgi:uncharacterized protein (TIGR02246 family)
MTRLLLLTLLLATASLAQAQRIPVTTVSDDARVHFVRGETALFNGEGTKARAHFDAAIAADPTFALAHAYRAVSARPAADDIREEHMRLAMQQSARITEGERQWIAAMQASLDGDTDSQIEIMTAMADIAPDDPRPPSLVAYGESSRGNPAAGVASARRAIAIDPSHYPAYNALGYAEMANGNMAAAEAAFQEQIRLAPGVANPYDSYGDFFMANDQLDEAEAQFQLALTQNPEFQGSRTKLTRIAVMRAAEAQLATFNRQDVDAFVASFTANAVLSLPDGSQLIGRDAIREAIVAYFASGQMTAEADWQEVRPIGDGTAYTRAATTTRMDGAVVDRGIDTSLWVETPEGWKIARDIWTSAPVSP